MTTAGSSRITLAGVALAAFLDATAPASAATVKCIEASRYSTLARITGGSLDKLAHGLLGKELHELPPPDACRAVLLSGPIGRGSANALLDAVVKSRGWLAWVYLAASDSDVIEETKIATIMRDFRLSSMIMLSDLDYVADFLTDPLPLPASVSYAWPEAQRATKGLLVERLDDYLQNTQRRITRGTDTCERGCWTIVAGSIDRHEAGLKVLLQGAKTMKPSSPEEKEAAKARAKVRHDFGLDILPQQRPFGWVSSQPFPRLELSILAEVKNACQPRIEYAAALQSEIGRDIDASAGHNFPYMDLSKIAPKFRSFQEASDSAELCVTQVLDRAREETFAVRCGPGCSPASLSESLDVRTRRIFGQSGAVDPVPEQP